MASFKTWGMARFWKETRARKIYGMWVTAAQLDEACSGMGGGGGLTQDHVKIDAFLPAHSYLAYGALRIVF